MKLSKITGPVALLFLAATLPAYAQKDEKENGKEQPQHTQQAGPEARPQQARPAQQPQRAPQSRPAEQAQQPRQQAPQQHQPQQAKAAAPEQPKPSPVRNSEQRSQPAAQQSARAPQAEHAPTRVQAEHAPAVAAHAQAPQVQRSASQAQSWQQQRGWVKQGGGWQPHTSFQQGRDQNWGSDHRDWSQRGGYGGAYIPQASFRDLFRELAFLPHRRDTGDVHGLSEIRVRRVCLPATRPVAGILAGELVRIG